MIYIYTRKDNITKKLLPIGTVVQLLNKQEKIMICGRQQIDLEEQVECDYLGCVYPKGIDNEGRCSVKYNR